MEKKSKAKNKNHKKGEMLKMLKKSGSQEDFVFTDSTGKETTYKLQYPGLREATKIKDKTKNALGYGFVEEELYNELMKTVIVEPRTSWDYWEENEGANEVLQAAQKFLIS